MRFEATFAREVQRRDRQRNNSRRKQRVRGQNDQVKHPDKPDVGESVSSGEDESEHVADKKYSGRDEGRLHPAPMHLDTFRANRDPSREQKRRARGVEKRVHRSERVANVRRVHLAPLALELLKRSGSDDERDLQKQ